MNEDIKRHKILLKNAFLFLIGGIVVQLIIYKAAHIFLAAGMILSAAILVLALSINSFIYLIGCLRMSYEFIDEIRKDKSDGKDR